MKMGYSRKSALLANFHNTLVKVTRGRKDVARAVEPPFAQFIDKRCFSPSQQRLHVAWRDRETACEQRQREVSFQEASIKLPQDHSDASRPHARELLLVNYPTGTNDGCDKI